MSTPSLVSILIPLHNKREWVRDAVRSALEQTYETIEVIVIDDGSTDGSAEELSDIDDPRLRIVRRENRGANATRNELLSSSSGVYVQYLDADDLLLPDKLERQVSALDAGRSVSICGIGRVEPDGAITPPAQDLRAFDLSWLVTHGLQTSAPLHRRQSLGDVGGWDPSLVASQEYDLHLRSMLAGLWESPHLIDDAGALWRHVAESVSSSDHVVYSAKVEVLRRVARDAMAPDQAVLAGSITNASRHLARSGDWAGAVAALGVAESLGTRRSVGAALGVGHRYRWPVGRLVLALERLRSKRP